MPFYPYRMHKTLFAFSPFGRQIKWQRCNNFTGNLYRAFHFSFPETGVRAYAVDGELRTISRESFILQVTGAFAVYGIGGIGAYFAYISLIYTPAYFLIGRKQYFNSPVLYF